jgi:hypothetical protein
MFADLLKTQLMLKGVVTEQDWKDMEEDIEFVFAQDAYYTESKEQEILRARVELLTQTDPFVGRYMTKKYVQKNILRFTEEEIEEMDAEMEEDASNSMDYSEPLEDPNQPGNILPKGSPFPAPPEKKKNGNK